MKIAATALVVMALATPAAAQSVSDDTPLNYLGLFNAGSKSSSHPGQSHYNAGGRHAGSRYGGYRHQPSHYGSGGNAHPRVGWFGRTGMRRHY